MFSNIGGKIKILAKVLCIVGFVITLILAIFDFVMAAQLHNGLFVVFGILCIILGALLSWINSFFVYAFGEITTKVSSLDEKVDSLGTEIKQKNTVFEALLAAKAESHTEKKDV